MAAHLLRRLTKKISPRFLVPLANFWSPYRGAGIRIRSVSEDFLSIDVEMKLRWFNTNYVGTHFGGSLYAMVDPFYMLMLMNNLGTDYIVWDKAAAIDFVKPGRGAVFAKFRFSEGEIAEIKARVDREGKIIFDRLVDIVDEAGDLVARVNKTLYVRKRS